MCPIPWRWSDDVEDWVQHYERVAHHNGWTPDQRLQNLYFSLDATSGHWFESNDASLTSWETCKSELVRTFANQYRRQHAEDLLQTRIQSPTESISSFVEDVLRLSARADPRATEEKKVWALMRGIRNDIFGGLIRNPPTTVAEFVAEATNIERALITRTNHYQRLGTFPDFSSPASSGLGGVGLADVREIIREDVREELKRYFSAPEQPVPVSIAAAVRDELRQAFALEFPPTLTTVEKPAVNYPDDLRLPPLVIRLSAGSRPWPSMPRDLAAA